MSMSIGMHMSTESSPFVDASSIPNRGHDGVPLGHRDVRALVHDAGPYGQRQGSLSHANQRGCHRFW